MRDHRSQSEALVRRVTLLALVATLVVPACSGEATTETFGSDPETESSAPTTDLVDAMRENILDDPERRFDEATTSCLVRGIVDEFGEAELAELGVTPESPDLEGGAVFATPGNARRVVDVGMGCIDLPAAIVSYLPASTELVEDSVQCVAEQLQTDTFRDFFAELIAAGAEPADLLGYGDAQLSIGSVILTCLNPEEILRVDELLP